MKSDDTEQGGLSVEQDSATLKSGENDGVMFRLADGTTDVEMLDASSKLVNEAAALLAPDNLRDLAGTLLRIADSVDQGWQQENVQSVFRWPSPASRIERNSLNLAMRAKAILRFRQVRSKVLPAEVLGEPGWQILLELFCQFAGGAAASSKSLTLISGVPQTTALRCLEKLEAEGLIKRRQSANDRRVTLFELTERGVVAVGKAIEQCPGPAW